MKRSAASITTIVAALVMFAGAAAAQETSEPGHPQTAPVGERDAERPGMIQKGTLPLYHVEVTETDRENDSFTVEGEYGELTLSGQGPLPAPGQRISLLVTIDEEGIRAAPITVDEEGVRAPITVNEEGVRTAWIIPHFVTQSGVIVREDGVGAARITVDEPGVRTTRAMACDPDNGSPAIEERSVGAGQVAEIVKMRTGRVTVYDSALQTGRYTEDGTGVSQEFHVTRPTIRVSPGDAVTVLHQTPGGKVIDIVIRVNGSDV